MSYVSDELTMTDVNSYLVHHGIKGQHWGVRRYQNPDGSLTPEGRARYSSDLKYNIGNTAVKGAKIGAGIGAGLGTGVAAVGASLLASTGAVPVGALIAYGASIVSAQTFASAFDGVLIGAAVGAIKTGTGKSWAKKNLGVK